MPARRRRPGRAGSRPRSRRSSPRRCQSPPPAVSGAPMRGFTAAGAAPSERSRPGSARCPTAAAIERWHRYFTREPHSATSPRTQEIAEYIADAVAGAGPGGRRHPPLRRAVVESAARRGRDGGAAPLRADAARGSVSRGSRTRRSRRSAARGRRSRPRATSPRRSSTPTAATRPTTTLLRQNGIDPNGQDRHRPLLESVQLPRVQGAHRRARRRGGDDRLLRSGRGRLRQGRGVPARVRGDRPATCSAAASPTTTSCPAIR